MMKPFFRSILHFFTRKKVTTMRHTIEIEAKDETIAKRLGWKYLHTNVRSFGGIDADPVEIKCINKGFPESIHVERSHKHSNTPEYVIQMGGMIMGSSKKMTLAIARARQLVKKKRYKATIRKQLTNPDFCTVDFNPGKPPLWRMVYVERKENYH